MKIKWIDGHRWPQNKPDPAFPDGIDIDMSGGASVTCKQTLPYPAERCGMYVVECETCHQRVIVTTAGRVDDPRSVKLACKLN